MKKTILTRICILSLLCMSLSLFGGIRKDTRFPLDGVNVFGAADSMLLFDHGFSITGSNPDDSFSMVPSIGDTAPYRLKASFLLGSETGDALLNSFSSPSQYPNRDHESIGSIVCFGKKAPVNTVVRYRYADIFSDRFDSIWARYNDINGYAMEFGQKGLVTEVFGATTFKLPAMKFSASLHKKDQWYATPYFFSPLYGAELTANPRFEYTTGSVHITSGVALRRSSWYFDHVHPVDFKDCFATGELRLFPDARMSGLLTINYNTAQNPAASVRCGVLYKNSLLDAGMHGSVFSNFHTAFDAYGVLRIGRQWSCSLTVAHDYRPKERSYYFLEFDTVVIYEPSSINRNTLSSTITWKAPVNFPLGISGWFFYNNRPRRESVTARNDTLFINQTTYRKSTRSFMGIKGFLDKNNQHWSISIRPAILLPFGNRENVHFFVGKTAVANVSGTTGGAMPATVTIGLTCNDRPMLNYLVTLPPDTFRIQTFTAPASASLYFSGRLPFIVPFFPEKIKKGSFILDAGPINLTGTLRQKIHPRGNLMGPAIYSRFEWIIQ